MFFRRRKPWWEKIGVSLILYSVFWAVFYGGLILIPNTLMFKYKQYFISYGKYYVFGLVPLLSLAVPIYLKKRMQMRLWVVILLHILMLAVSLVAFFAVYYYKAYTLVDVSGFVE